MTLSRPYYRHGFTLIELLVVIAVIALLAAILFPVFGKAREKARQTTCMSNQRQIAARIMMFAHDHEDRLPYAKEIRPEHLFEPGTFFCPTAGKKVRNPYVFNGQLAGVTLGDIGNLSETMLTADGESTDDVARTMADLRLRHFDKVALSYADGHVAVRDPKGLLPGQSIFSDHFTAATLDPAWTVATQGGRGYLQLTGSTYLRYYLQGPATSTEGGVLSPASPSTSIARSFTGDQWTLETRLVYRLHNKDGGSTGIQSPVLAVAFDDNATNVACTRSVDYGVPSNLLAIYGRNTPTLATDLAENLLPAWQQGTARSWMDDVHYYRITRDGLAVTMATSLDGVSYTTVRSYSLPSGVGPTQTVALDASVGTTAGSYADWDFINVNALY
ncbi:MAG: type II secretion system protein [Armatimonadota bacterium]